MQLRPLLIVLAKILARLAVYGLSIAAGAVGGAITGAYVALALIGPRPEDLAGGCGLPGLAALPGMLIGALLGGAAGPWLVAAFEDAFARGVADDVPDGQLGLKPGCQSGRQTSQGPRENDFYNLDPL